MVNIFDYCTDKLDYIQNLIDLAHEDNDESLDPYAEICTEEWERFVDWVSQDGLSVGQPGYSLEE